MINTSSFQCAQLTRSLMFPYTRRQTDPIPQMLYLKKLKMHDNIENNNNVYGDTWIHKELELYINAIWYQHDIRICVASNGPSGWKCVTIWLICELGQNEVHDHYGSMSHTYLHLHKHVHTQANNMSFAKCEVTNQSIASFYISGDSNHIILLFYGVFVLPVPHSSIPSVHLTYLRKL